MGFDFIEISLRTMEGTATWQNRLWESIYQKAQRENNLSYFRMNNNRPNLGRNRNSQNRNRRGRGGGRGGGFLPTIDQSNALIPRSSQGNRSSRNNMRNSQNSRLQPMSNANSHEVLRNSHSNFNRLNVSPSNPRRKRKSTNIKLDPVSQSNNNSPPKKKKKLTLDDLGNIAPAAPYSDFSHTGIQLDPNANYKINPYRPPRARRVIPRGGLDLNTKNQMREILAGLHYTVRKEIERQQITFVELTRIRTENTAIKERVTYGNILTKNWVDSSEMIVGKMTDFYDKYCSQDIEVFGGQLVQVVCCDSRGEVVLDPVKPGEKISRPNKIIEIAADLNARIEVNNFFIDSFFDDKVQLKFEEVLDVLDGRFKKEFMLRCELVDETQRKN